MDDALTLHRLQFAFTIIYHYLFPQLTMGLALLLALLKGAELKTGSAHYGRCVQFWTRIFGINFAMGVVTGIPMEFQFGTNWSRFSSSAGGVIGQTLAMEGVFAFFLESTFIGLVVYGEKRLGRRLHAFATLMVFVGSWLSGYFIVATNAWMQHPVGYAILEDGTVVLESFQALLLNPWALTQYAHTMAGAVVTASFAMASIGAYYLLDGQHKRYGRTFVRLGVVVALVASTAQVFPTGDIQGRMIAEHQPATLAAMEGLFETKAGAPLVLIGQPDMRRKRLDNPVEIPNVLSFLTYQSWAAEVRGLDAFPDDQWPDNVPLLYYAYHIMVGLGTLFIGLAALACWQLQGGRLFENRWLLWPLMLALPFPYIANTAGWLTAELGRQPWLIYGLMRTADGSSPRVSAGSTLFTLLGFMGIYALMSILFLFLVSREIARGPDVSVDSD